MYRTPVQGWKESSSSSTCHVIINRLNYFVILILVCMIGRFLLHVILFEIPISVLLYFLFTPLAYYFKLTHNLLLYTMLSSLLCTLRYALYALYRGMLEEQIFALRKTSETRLESLKKEAVMVRTYERTICAYTYRDR